MDAFERPPPFEARRTIRLPLAGDDPLVLLNQPLKLPTAGRPGTTEQRVGTLKVLGTTPPQMG
jgi:hypothetical protein